MAILRLTSSTRQSGTSTISADQLKNVLTNYPYQITLTGGLNSTSKTTGHLTIIGGVGLTGNVYLDSLIGSGNITAAHATLAYSLSVGAIRSTSIQNSGAITASSGNINQFSATAVTATQGTFNSLNVTNTATVGTISATNGAITTQTGTTASISTVNSTNVNVTNLAVDAITARTGSQINLGAPTQLAISGGVDGYALTTDGAGNLRWGSSALNLSVGYGLVKSGSQINLDTSGISPGTYTAVTVDSYGRALSGVNLSETLNTVTARGASTTRAITINNSTDSSDINIGALVVVGGLGVGLTLTTTDLVVQNTAGFYNGITVQNTSTLNGTLTLTAQAAGGVPLVLSSGTLNGGAPSGAMEYDGQALYITTTAGRQIIMMRQSGQTATPVILVRAAATSSVSVTTPSPTLFDDVVLNTYDKVLLTGQSTSSENGVYVFTATGVPLVRSSDSNSITGIYSGTEYIVSEGTVYAGSTWRLETTGTVVVDGTNLIITQIFSKDNISLSRLPKNSSAGILTRTTYGNLAMRAVTTTSSFLTITNPGGVAGDITIASGIVPVASGGTGRASFFGYLRGLGTTTTSSNTIPVASVAGLGTMATQNADAVTITGGSISVTSVTATGNISGNNLVATRNITTAGNISAGNISVNNQATIGNLIITGNLSIIGGFTSGGASFGTLASQDASFVSITGGNINGVAIGSTTASSGKFTTLESTGDAIIGGNLTVHGTTTTVDATTISVGDLNIELGKNSLNAAQSQGGGISLNLGTDGFARIEYDYNHDAWGLGRSIRVAGGGNFTGAVTADSFAGLIKPSAGSDTNQGIIFPNNPGGGTGDYARIQYYAYSGENTVLELLAGNEAGDYIKLNAPGGVTVVNTLTAGHVTDSSLASGSVVFAGSSGQLTDDAQLTYNSSSNTLTVNNLVTYSGALGIGSNVDIGSGKITLNATTGDLGIAGNLAITGNIQASNFNVGQLTASNLSTGNVTANAVSTGTLTTGNVTSKQIVYANAGNVLVGSAAFTYDYSTQTLGINAISANTAVFNATTSYTAGNYATGAVAVAGDVSIGQRLQVSGNISTNGTIFKNGYELLGSLDTIDGGTY